MSDYEIKAHSELGEVVKELAELTCACFGEYEGVIAVDEEFLRWYLSRPGMARDGCFAAVRDGRIVSSVFVTRLSVQFGGELLEMGMLDTVMTHPEHRRQGLARRVLDAATRFMQDRGMDGSQLYTGADSMPQRFYTGLGYREYVRVRYLMLTDRQRVNLLSARAREAPGAAEGIEGRVRECDRQEVPQLRRFLDESFSAYDGYMPLNDELWAWRRERRPANAPATPYLLWDKEAGIEATATLASAPLRKSRGVEVMTGVLDFAASDTARAGAFLGSVIRNAPLQGALVLVSATVNGRLNALCGETGFTCFANEVSMVKAFSDKGRKALAGRPSLWYTATESLIGM